MSAPGSAVIDDADAERLREYLFKGGMLWTDDFWGTYQWEHWEDAASQGASRRRVPDLRRAARSSAASGRNSK